jgi:hypothetical protein
MIRVICKKTVLEDLLPFIRKIEDCGGNLVVDVDTFYRIRNRYPKLYKALKMKEDPILGAYRITGLGNTRK